MNLRALNQICFTICIVCIVLGVVLSISMIWKTYDNEFLWKSWLTIGVFFVASALTMGVTRFFRGQEPHPGGQCE